MTNIIYKLRRSRTLVVFVVFLALMLDVMLMTSVDPILPGMLRTIQDRKRKHLSVCQYPTTTLNINSSWLPYSSEFAIRPAGNVSNTRRTCYCCLKQFEVYDEKDIADQYAFCNDNERWSSVSSNMSESWKLCCNACNLLLDTTSPSLDSPTNTTLSKQFRTGQPILRAPHQGVHTEHTPAVGLLVAVKPGVELVSNLPVGWLVDRVGHQYPMIIGCVFNFFATLGFAYATSFWELLITRVLQAIASSLSVVGALAFLASVFIEDGERAKANSRAFAGISMGIILGYPYGSVVYQFLGQKAPFLILAGATLVDGALRLLLVSPRERKGEKQTSDLCRTAKLLADGYILIGLGCVLFIHQGLGVFLATGPAWMLDALHAQQWNIGVVLAVAVLFHILAQTITGLLAVQLGRWLFCWLGMIFFSIGIATYPLCTSIWHVLGPEIAVRIGHGTVLCVISPLLGYIADMRHGSCYGTVYGLYTAAYNLGICTGSVGGGMLMKYWPFKIIYWGMAVLIAVYSFTSFAFRRFSCSRILVEESAETQNYGTIDSTPSKTTAAA